MRTIKQEIKALKVGEEKILKVDFESEYITIRKSKLKGLEIFINDEISNYGQEIDFAEIKNNFTDYTVYKTNAIDY